MYPISLMKTSFAFPICVPTSYLCYKEDRGDTLEAVVILSLIDTTKRVNSCSCRSTAPAGLNSLQQRRKYWKATR